MMISKNKIKLIRSLDLKKNRKERGVFVAEGPKVVEDLMEFFTPVTLVYRRPWQPPSQIQTTIELIEVSEEEMHKVSFLQHPQEVLGIFPIAPLDASIPFPQQELSIALDGVQDPGNLGTIIRVADWFGIRNIYCSEDTADVYNPKVVQATMGSIARVNVTYTDLRNLIGQLPADYPVYGTLLDGKDIYVEPLTSFGLIIMGNEGNGISPEIRKKVNRRLRINNFPPGRKTADSLNVAIATAITCSEFRRR